MKKRIVVALLSLALIVTAGGAGVAFAVWELSGGYGAAVKESGAIQISVEASQMDGSYGGWTDADIPAYAVLDGAVNYDLNPALTGLTLYKTDTGRYDGEILMDKWLTVQYTCSELATDYTALLFGIRVEVEGELAEYFEASELFETAASSAVERDPAMPYGYANLRSIADNKYIKVEETDLLVQTETVVKKDENGDPVAATDENGNPLTDENGDPVYKTETVVKTDENGDPVAVTDEDGNPITTTSEDDGYVWLVTFKINTGAISSFLSYKDGKCPQTKEEYDAIKAALEEAENSTLKIILYQGRATPSEGAEETNGSENAEVTE